MVEHEIKSLESQYNFLINYLKDNGPESVFVNVNIDEETNEINIDLSDEFEQEYNDTFSEDERNMQDILTVFFKDLFSSLKEENEPNPTVD